MQTLLLMLLHMQEGEQRIVMAEDYVRSDDQQISDTVAVHHGIDKARTIVHDLDRAGDYYSAWCVCGHQICNRAPHWLPYVSPHNGCCRSSVLDYLEDHVRALIDGDETPSLRAAMREKWDADVPVWGAYSDG